MKEDTWGREVLKLIKDFDGQAETCEINENIEKFKDLTDELKAPYGRSRKSIGSVSLGATSFDRPGSE